MQTPSEAGDFTLCWTATTAVVELPVLVFLKRWGVPSRCLAEHQMVDLNTFRSRSKRICRRCVMLLLPATRMPGLLRIRMAIDSFAALLRFVEADGGSTVTGT